MSGYNPAEMEDWLDEVDVISQEVQDIISGKVDIEASVEKERLAKEKARIAAEEKKAREEAKIRAGKEGKGEKFDTYQRFCKFCFVEYAA
jgi:hypothetical protein